MCCNLKCIITDIGGVCISNAYATMSETLKRRFGTSQSLAFGILIEEAVAFDAGHVTVDEFSTRVLSRLGLKIDAGEFISIMDSSEVPNRDVWNLLQRVKATGAARIIALSNMPEHTWNMLNRTYGLGTLFDGAVLSYAVGVVKPERRIFEMAIEASGTSAGNCLFVDDAPENVAVAEKQCIVSHLFRDADCLAEFLKDNGIMPRG